MVESGGLENRCARKGTEGSNPSPSASSARVPLAVIADSNLYARGNATLLASWEAYARGSAGAALHRLDGVAAAVFPSEPESNQQRFESPIQGLPNVILTPHVASLTAATYRTLCLSTAANVVRVLRGEAPEPRSVYR